MQTRSITLTMELCLLPSLEWDAASQAAHLAQKSSGICLPMDEVDSLGSFEHPSSDDGRKVGGDFSMPLMLIADIIISV